jgi:transcriptional regulator with XRE-family HTH domain
MRENVRKEISTMNSAIISLRFSLDGVSRDWIDSLALPGTVWSSSNKTTMQQIGENISLEIRRSGYQTIASFAMKAKVNPSTLYKILLGKSNPRLSTMKRIADALGKQVNELLVTSTGKQRTGASISPIGTGELEVSIELPLGTSLPEWLLLALTDRDRTVQSPEI